MLFILCCMEGTTEGPMGEGPMLPPPTGLRPGMGTAWWALLWLAIIPGCMVGAVGTGGPVGPVGRGPIVLEVPRRVCMEDSSPCHSFSLSACFLSSSSLRASSLRISIMSCSGDGMSVTDGMGKCVTHSVGPKSTMRGVP